jgi:rhamnosyltransferase
MENVKLAVIISTYNGAKFIGEQILSILNQDKKNNLDYSVEIIIRDDGSTDDTVEVINLIAKKHHNVKLLNDSFGNLGVKCNFFELLKHVEDYDFIFFSDQDDIWASNKIIKYIDKAIEYKILNSSYPVEFFSDAFISDAKGHKTGLKMSEQLEWIGNEHINYQFLSLHDLVTGATMCINKEAVKLINKIPNVDPESIAMHDYFISLVVATFGTVICINEPLIYYRQHGGNLVGANIVPNKGIQNRIELALKRLELFISDNSKIYFMLKDNSKNILSKIDHEKKVAYFKNFFLLRENPSVFTRYKIINNIEKYVRKKHKLITIFLMYTHKF